MSNEQRDNPTVVVNEFTKAARQLASKAADVAMNSMGGAAAALQLAQAAHELTKADLCVAELAERLFQLENRGVKIHRL